MKIIIVQKLILSLFAWAGLTTAILAQNMESKTYYFPVNGYGFTSKMQKDLSNFISGLDTIESVEIYGFCDSTGSIKINEKLSLRRAESAKKQLIRRGISKDVITVKGLGEKSPISEKVPNYEFDHNRKVEIVAYVKWNPKNNVNYLIEKLDSKGTDYTVRPHKDTALLTDKGTMIVIAKNTFKTASNSPITLNINEYFDKSQMVANNLTTTSEGKWMEDGKMIKITAIQDGETLSQELNVPIQISTSTKVIKDKLQTFYGDRKEDGFVYWTPNATGGKVHTGKGPASSGEYPGVILPGDTLRNPKSRVCDSLRAKEDDYFVAKFNIIQKIFWGKAKKNGIREALAKELTSRDSCSACYNAYKMQELGKKQRKSKMKKVVADEKSRKQNEVLNGPMADSIDVNYDEKDYYVFSIFKTGLVNVDKLIKYNQNKIDILVTDCNQSINAKLVFDDNKVLLPSEKTKEGFIFRSVPSGINVTLFAIKFKDEQIGFYNEAFTTDYLNMKFNMIFTDTDMDAINIEFLKLD